jgi:hypothetical protein
VHLLGGADDCIHRTGFDALGAADADFLLDHRNLSRLFHAELVIERPEFAVEESREPADACSTSGRALVDVGFACGNCFGVGLAAAVAAFTALSLWQYRIDLFNKGRDCSHMVILLYCSKGYRLEASD